MNEYSFGWQYENGFVRTGEKLKIYYSPKAFAKTVRLIQEYQVEIGWNMLVKPYMDGYKVYDIVVYPQRVMDEYIAVDVTRYGIWKAYLDDDVQANLNGQGHSHVNMEAFVSGIDERQQYGQMLTKRKGFYFYQVWNKKNEVVSRFYDIVKRKFYDNDDIEMIVEDVDNIIESSYRMVV